MILDDIIKNKKQEVEERKKELPLPALVEKAGGLPATRDFKKAVAKPGRVNVIAEIKRKSPSAGLIRQDLAPVEIAKIYEANGASAISVLTDNKYFGGDYSILSEVSSAVSLPVICKEFIIDEYQLYEARCAGADAVLLIAAVLDAGIIDEYIKIASGLGLACLVEAHSTEEVDTVIGTGAEIIGINNRNLKDLKVNVQATFRLRNRVPKDRVLVSESGISCRNDIGLMREHEINAVLVGESLMKADDIAGKLKELIW